MKTNKKNGKSINLTSTICRMTLDMVTQYNYIKSRKAINPDSVIEDYRRFIELDGKILTYASMAEYKSFDEILDDLWEAIALYGRIVAYKEKYGVYVNLEKTFIYLLDDKLVKQIDYALAKNYESESVNMMLYLCEYVLRFIVNYRISFKIDKYGDIVRVWAGDNAPGHRESQYIIKRYYLCK